MVSTARIGRRYTDVFCVAFSHGHPALISPLSIELATDASPEKLMLRNYSEDQSAFLQNMTSQLVEAGMACPNFSARWASAPLLVPKPGPVKFCFTFNLRTVNRFTLPHHYPMPRMETELPKLTGSTCSSNFDLSHGYW